MEVPELRYTASPRVAAAVSALGRTEDVRFSPSNRRVVIAAFSRHRLAAFDVEIAASPNEVKITLTGGVELASPSLRLPHGVDFIDDDTVIVTNRGGDVALIALPPGAAEVPSLEVAPIARWPTNETTLWNVPGSVAVTRVEHGECEVLICNNDRHTVTRHQLSWNGKDVTSSEVLLQKHLAIPDGVAVSPDRRWIAVSNHSTHSVLLYENSPDLDGDAEPSGILRSAYYPHGLRFSADGRHLFVADAGAPYVHVYAPHPDEWRGVRHPVGTVRVMDDATFRRARHNPQEGGPKGLAIDAGSNVLAVTSESQALAFFDLRTLLEHAVGHGSRSDQGRLDVRYELSLMQDGLRMAREATEASFVRSSLSWRLTAPLRRLNALVRRRAPRSGPGARA
jgi:DNA-binding beta-propeller fold protein YncE